MLASAASLLRLVVRNELLVLTLPQQLVIPSKVMAAVLRTSQLLLGGVIITYVLRDQSFSVREQAARNLHLWTERPPLSQIEHQNATSLPYFCRHPEAYWNNATSSSGAIQRTMRPLQPHGCAPSGYDFDILDSTGSTFIVATAVRQRITQKHRCSVSEEKRCSSQSAAITPVVHAAYYNSTTSGICECLDEFFLPAAEQTMLVLHHETSSNSAAPDGFVDVDGSHAFIVLRGTSRTPCLVGTQERWDHHDVAAGGIRGSLQDWLACAGVKLDDRPGGPAATGPVPPFRATGLVLQLTLNCTNMHAIEEHNDETLCVVTVEQTLQRSFMSTPERDTFGVSVKLRVTGAIRAFDARRFVSSFVECFVLAQIPGLCAQFVCLYCLGVTSAMYRRARRRVFNVPSNFCTTVTKMMVSEMGFRGLMGGVWQGRVANLDGITQDALHAHLHDLLHHQLGGHEAGELSKMVAIAFKALDDDGSSTIQCPEFVKACLADEVIDLQLMSRLLLNREKGGLRFLDEADAKMRKRIKSLTPEDLTRVRTESSIENSPKAANRSRSAEVSDVASLLRATDIQTVAAHVQGQLDEILSRLQALERMHVEHRLGVLEARLEASLVHEEEIALRVERRLQVLEASLVQEKDMQAWRCMVQEHGSKFLSLDEAVTQLQEQCDQLKEEIVELQITSQESLQRTSGMIAAGSGANRNAGGRHHVSLPSKEVSPSQIGRKSLLSIKDRAASQLETTHSTQESPFKSNQSVWHPMFGDSLRAVAKSPQTTKF